MGERGSSATKRRETIRRGSPFLESFLGHGMVDDRNKWAEEMTVPFREIYEKFISTYTDSLNGMINPLKIMSEELGLFDPAYSEKGKEVMICAVIVIGYEIGDTEATPLFAKEVVKRLSEIRAFDASVYKNPKKRVVAENFVTAVFKIGISWGEKAPTGVPPEFLHFIQGITH